MRIREDDGDEGVPVDLAWTGPRIRFAVRMFRAAVKGQTSKLVVISVDVVEVVSGCARAARLVNAVLSDSAPYQIALAMLRHLEPLGGQRQSPGRPDPEWGEMVAPLALEVVGKLPTRCTLEGADVVAFVRRELTGRQVLARMDAESWL